MKKFFGLVFAVCFLAAKVGVAADSEAISVEDLKLVEETVVEPQTDAVAQHGHHHGHHHGGHHGGHHHHGHHHHHHHHHGHHHHWHHGHHHHHHWSNALSSNTSVTLPSPKVQI